MSDVIEDIRSLIESQREIVGELENRLDQPKNEPHDLALLRATLSQSNTDLQRVLDILRARHYDEEFTGVEVIRDIPTGDKRYSEENPPDGYIVFTIDDQKYLIPDTRNFEIDASPADLEGDLTMHICKRKGCTMWLIGPNEYCRAHA